MCCDSCLILHSVVGDRRLHGATLGDGGVSVEFTTECEKMTIYNGPAIEAFVWHLWSVAEIDGDQFVFEENYHRHEVGKDDAILFHTALARQAFERRAKEMVV